MNSVILDRAPSDVIKYLLVFMKVGVLPGEHATSGWPIYVSQRPNEPDDLIAIYDTGGYTDGRHHIDGEVQEQYGMEILVRGVGTNSLPGYRRARRMIDGICKILDQNVWNIQVNISPSSYIVHSMNKLGVVRRQGPSQSDNERFVFTVQYTTSISQIS